MDIQGQVIVITGGASGIGAALAQAFFEEGAKAIVCADLDLEGAKAVTAPFGDKGMACKLDVTDTAAVQAMVTSVEDTFGPVDFYVSNAGIGIGDSPTWTSISQTDEQFELVWKVNVQSHIYALRAVLPGMIERKHGGFLITASAAGLLTLVGDASYSATKHAAVGLAESIAISHGDDGIYVGCLCPQGVQSKMTAPMKNTILNQLGIIPAEELAEKTVAAVKAGHFMIRPHETVEQFFMNKAENYERWIAGMRKMRRHQLETHGIGM